LYQTFIHCGTISRIQIRCSRGSAVTIGQPVAAHMRTPRDRQYASIEFASPASIRKALRLDGCILHGARLVVRFEKILSLLFLEVFFSLQVSISPADLPEVRDVIMKRVGRFRNQLGERPRSA